MAADGWGVEDGYWSVDRGWIDTPEPTRAALRAAMGGNSAATAPPPPDPPLWIVPAGSAPSIDRPARLELEDGSEVPAGAALSETIEAPAEELAR